MPKDPRTYSWKIDSLNNTILDKIWASSPHDVYVAGKSKNYESLACMWHFNGLLWKPIELPEAESDGVYSNVVSIYGFSSVNLWAITYVVTDFKNNFKCDILHFDGNIWKNSLTVNGISLKCIWGNSPSDIWAGGDTLLLHFDGSNWSQFSFLIPPQNASINSICGLSSNDIYLTGHKPDSNTPISYLYHFNGSQWSLIDSSYGFTGNEKFGWALKTIGGTLYSYHNYLYERMGNIWTKIYSNPIAAMGGNSSNNLFVETMYDNGTINHYNGIDWEKLSINEGFYGRMEDIWVNETEVFMVATGIVDNHWTTFVVQGK